MALTLMQRFDELDESLVLTLEDIIGRLSAEFKLTRQEVVEELWLHGELGDA